MERIQPGVTLTESITITGQQEIPSAVPIFIGYTAHDLRQVKTAVRINNLAEYTRLFGDDHLMALAVRLYFDNGGQQAFVLPLQGNMPSANITQAEAEILMAALGSDAVREAIGGET
ncbi:hypothetical protein ACR71G_16395 [Xenorhabdus bovienii]|uniref:hypothetical protein n=1 Tax=Xenorhabdus bovienii TaxID=40576 RepID=UPI003DA51954